MSKRLFFIILLIALFMCSAALVPIAYANIGGASTIEKTADVINKDKVYFKVKNNENVRIMDFHIKIDGAKIISISTPNGWSAQGTDGNGKPIAQPPYYDVHWTANSTSTAIQPGNFSGEFDIEIEEGYTDYNFSEKLKHIITAWITYEDSGTAGQCPYSKTIFKQKRANEDSPWTTEETQALAYYKESIGPSGGSLAMGTDGTIVVSAGDVTAATWFGGCALPGYVPDYIGQMTSDNGQIMKSYILGPHGEDFANPVTVSLSYASVPGIRNPRPYLYNPETNTWSLVSGAIVDAENQQVTFQTTHFSIYGIGGEPAPVPATSKWSILMLGLGGIAVLLWQRRKFGKLITSLRAA